jgi:peptidyl-prolyl cis-trans isomerase SurA
MARRANQSGKMLLTLPTLLLFSLGGWALGQAPPTPPPPTPVPSPVTTPAPVLTAPGRPTPSQTATPKAGRAASQGTVKAAPAVMEETAKPAAGVLVDQVIAVVNGELILESDIDEERRFEAFQPFRAAANGFQRDKAIERLVDRALILQQAKVQPAEGVNGAEAKAQLLTLRKEIPACKQYHCETDAGWQSFVKDQGFTMEGLVERWRERMEILQFIEMRFKMGIHIQPEEIKAYYDKTLLPEYAQQHAPAPKLETISDRIEEVLLQQRVSSLLLDWLETLKAQGTVRMMKQGEVAP